MEEEAVQLGHGKMVRWSSGFLGDATMAIDIYVMLGTLSLF